MHDIDTLLQDLYDRSIDKTSVLELINRLAEGESLDDILKMSHRPVDIHTFIHDPYFMGTTLTNLWESTIESVEEVINGGYSEAIFTGSIGRAKTTRATIVCAYNLYTLSCHHSPQEALGLMENSDLYVVMINRTDTLARKVTYSKFRKLIERIPYFRERFMFDEGVESEMRFPKNIFVIPSIPSNENLLGLDVVSGIVDEANFYSLTENSKRSLDGGTYDQAEEIYHGLVTRIASRFEGIDPTLRGCLSVVSSFKHSEDFTSTRIKEVEEARKRGEKIITYISTGSQWDFLPPTRKDGTRRFSETRFKVAIGNKRLRSEIIPDESPEHVQGREVIEVPDNFLPQFQRNIEKALRDLAGRVSGSTGSYFSNPEVVWDAVANWNSREFTNMFAIPEEELGWDLNDGFDILNKYYRPQHAHIPRFMHMDLSLTSDWLGLAIGYSPNDTVKRQRYTDPDYMLDSAPNIIIEGMLSIRPPKVGEIQYAELRRLIYYILEKTRIPLKYVSADGFQSVDHLQILKTRLNVETKKISVEGEEAYKSLKNTYDDARIIHPNHPVYMREILHVVQDEKTGRIDHLAHFSKDLSDAVCGVHTNIQRIYAAGELYRGNKSVMRGLYQPTNKTMEMTSHSADQELKPSKRDSRKISRVLKKKPSLP